VRTSPPYLIGVSGFLLMLGIGTMYGLSALQVALPSILGASATESLIPFGAASVGLAGGTAIGERVQRLLGARRAAAAGVFLWGASFIGSGAALAAGNLAGLGIAFLMGGIGVGVAYLVIVPTVGASFPTRPLIGSAIGPLGFASGTAIFALAMSTLDLPELTSEQAFMSCAGIGVVIAALALIGMPYFPSTRTKPPTTGNSGYPATRTRDAQRELSVLLFANALPGMMVFTIAVDLVRQPLRFTTLHAEHGVAVLALFLFLGGLLAPGLRRRFGAQKTLIALLILRGALLVSFGLVAETPLALIVLIVVLFGHGAGFSLLPPLMRSHGAPEDFTRNYGQVLISWGLAGITAVGILWFSRSSFDSDSPAMAVAGLIALLGAAWLFRSPAQKIMTAQ
jgi:hypothetical protein